MVFCDSLLMVIQIFSLAKWPHAAREHQENEDFEGNFKFF